MDESLRLGTIAGVRVGLNWSVLVIFALIFVGLAAGQFPIAYPDLSPVTYAVAGGIAAVVFFASLLAHEVSHALVARSHGLDVEGITLWLFGGVAKLGGEPPDPRADLRIAGVGPLVSLVLSGVFLLLAVVLGQLGVTGITLGVLSWLGLINLLLAVFNLMPAAPLDGGRILRAILWKRRGDRTSAAVTASRAGRTFGFVLVGLGLAQIILTPGLNGIWLMLIGWFIVTAAGAEEQHARLQNQLSGVEVSDVMTPDPMTIPPGLTVQELLDDYMLRNRFSAFPIVDDTGTPRGLVTLNRLKTVDPSDRTDVRVERIACPMEDVPTFHRSQPLAEVLPELQGCTDGRALVLEDGRVIGIVSPTDVTRMLQFADLRAPDTRERV